MAELADAVDSKPTLRVRVRVPLGVLGRFYRISRKRCLTYWQVNMDFIIYKVSNDVELKILKNDRKNQTFGIIYKPNMNYSTCTVKA